MTEPTSPDGDRTADLERRLAALERNTPRAMMEEGRSGLEEAFWAVMHSVFPDEARRHLRAATKEQLMAARYYLDRWIAGLEESAAPAEPPEPPRPTHEKIEVE
jgi:type II secretory pathway component PulJ